MGWFNTSQRGNQFKKSAGLGDLVFEQLSGDSGSENWTDVISSSGVLFSSPLILNCYNQNSTAGTITTSDSVDLTEAGSGSPEYNTGTPATGSQNDSVTKTDAGYWAESAARAANVPAGDLRISAIIKTPSNVATTEVLAKAHNGTDGWELRWNGSSQLPQLFVENGGSNVTVNAGSTAADAVTWYYVSFYVDYTNDIGVGYRNASKGVTAAATLAPFGTDTAALQVLTGATGDGSLAYLRIDGGSVDLTDQGAGARLTDTVEDELFVRYCGFWPKTAANKPPTTYGRLSAAYLRKWTGSEYELYRVGSNWPRVEKIYDGTVAKIGYLSEQQHTNKINHSIDLDNAVWTKSEITSISESSTPAPDGSYRALDIIANSNNAIHSITSAYAGGALVVGERYSSSVYAKPGAVDWIVFTPQSGKVAYVNVATGAIGATVSAGLFVKVEGPFPNGFRRISVYFEHVAGGALFLAPAEGDGDPFFAGDGVSVSMTMFNACAIDDYCCPSSIDTSGGIGTRVADTMTLDGNSNLGSDSPAALTVVADVITDDHDTDERIAYRIDGATDYVYTGFSNGSGAGGFGTYSSGGGVADNDANFDDEAWNNCKVRLKENNLENILDGDSSGIDTVVTMPASLTNIKIGWDGTAKQFNGNIGNIKIYKRLK